MFLLKESTKVFIYCIIAGISLAILLYVIFGIIKLCKIRQMYKEVHSKLLLHAKDKEMVVTKVNTYGFNYLVEEKNKLTYIKVIPNLNNYEININNKYMWQIRKSYNDKDLHFVDGIETPIRANIKNTNKTVEKLFIIYPNCSQLMIALNECEYAFVTENTDVYGFKVLTYAQFKHLIEKELD